MAIPGFSNLTKLVPSSSTAFDLLNPANARRAISGLLPGGLGGFGKALPNIGFGAAGANGAASAASEDDWRVRLSLADNSQLFYKNAGTSSTQNQIMSPLAETNGVIWPYTPQISISHIANYSTTPLTHSNYSTHFYNNSDVADISISGEFTVQSAEEGQYLMAVVYFLRASTKMFFGQGANAGNPPPILFLDGYGSHYFPHVPVVITNFTHQLPNDVDYIQVPITQTTLTESAIEPATTNFGSVDLATNSITGPNGETYVPSLLQSSTQATTARTQATVANAQKVRTSFSSITSTTRVPTNSTVSVTLRPVYSRAHLHDRFNLDDFASGALIGDKKKGYGGFI